MLIIYVHEIFWYNRRCSILNALHHLLITGLLYQEAHATWVDSYGSYNNNNNGDFLYSAQTMLCAVHTYYPCSLDLFIHVPFQPSFLEHTALAAISALGTSHTHCHLCPTRYSFTPKSSEACESTVPCPRTQHRNNVPILRGDKHDISLKMLHQAGFDTARQALTLAKLRALAIATRPSLGGGPRVVVSIAAFHARVRGSVPGLGCLKETTNVFSPSTCESQYCGEPPWPKGSVLGLRPPGLEFWMLCLEDSVISIISPSSGGSPGPV